MPDPDVIGPGGGFRPPPGTDIPPLPWPWSPPVQPPPPAPPPDADGFGGLPTTPPALGFLPGEVPVVAPYPDIYTPPSPVAVRAFGIVSRGTFWGLLGAIGVEFGFGVARKYQERSFDELERQAQADIESIRRAQARRERDRYVRTIPEIFEPEAAPGPTPTRPRVPIFIPYPSEIWPEPEVVADPQVTPDPEILVEPAPLPGPMPEIVIPAPTIPTPAPVSIPTPAPSTPASRPRPSTRPTPFPSPWPTPWPTPLGIPLPLPVFLPFANPMPIPQPLPQPVATPVPTPTPTPIPTPVITPYANPVAAPWANPLAQPTTTDKCTEVKRKRKRNKCYEGYYAERQGRTIFTDWRQVDCITGKTCTKENPCQ